MQAVKARSTHSRTNKPPDQTHCLPVLFSSVSPLIEENLKVCDASEVLSITTCFPAESSKYEHI